MTYPFDNSTDGGEVTRMTKTAKYVSATWPEQRAIRVRLIPHHVVIKEANTATR